MIEKILTAPVLSVQGLFLILAVAFLLNYALEEIFQVGIRGFWRLWSLKIKQELEQDYKKKWAELDEKHRRRSLNVSKLLRDMEARHQEEAANLRSEITRLTQQRNEIETAFRQSITAQYRHFAKTNPARAETILARASRKLDHAYLGDSQHD